MVNRLDKIRWDLFEKRNRLMLMKGLKKGLIIPYYDELIEKLRNIYYGGIPASILLLSDGMTNGYCCDRALLMARAFLNDDDDVNLLYASIDSIRLNPQWKSDNPLYADHCIVERITKDGKHYIYDTSAGFIFDKDYYWTMEHPKVRYVNNKDSIIKFIDEEEKYHPSDIDSDKYIATIILPILEQTFSKPNEMYSVEGISLLQREIDYYKKKINYDKLVEEEKKDMKRINLIKQKLLKKHCNTNKSTTE